MERIRHGIRPRKREHARVDNEAFRVLLHELFTLGAVMDVYFVFRYMNYQLGC